MKKTYIGLMVIAILGLLLLSGCTGSYCKTDADCNLNQDCRTYNDIYKQCTIFSCGTNTISGETEYLVNCIDRTGESHRCLSNIAIESKAFGECVKV